MSKAYLFMFNAYVGYTYWLNYEERNTNPVFNVCNNVATSSC